MSQSPFIHDFFRDGRLDVLDEIRLHQAYGQWTVDMRADWTLSAKASFERAKCTHPHIPQASSYYAGRIAGLKSRTSAHYPTLDLDGSVVFLPTTDKRSCLECGERSSWKCHLNGDGSFASYFCDRCKQECVRDAIASICRWDAHEGELLPVPAGDKLVVKEQPDLGSVLAPVTAIIGLGMLDLMVHAPAISFFFQIWFVLGVAIQDKDIWQKLCNWFEKM